MTEPQQISREQAEQLAESAWRIGPMDRCDTFKYLPPNGIGATGQMSSLFGYRNNECLFFTACFALLSGDTQ